MRIDDATKTIMNASKPPKAKNPLIGVKSLMMSPIEASIVFAITSRVCECNRACIDDFISRSSSCAQGHS
ncbi:MAG: hypothetical protein ACI9DF_004475 [Verrucomicrobiales bacterium]|jgi:hypothetical protein